jgi:tetratricopeptide (TPR) repeat protein
MNRVLLRLLLLGAIGAVATPGRALAQSTPAPVDKRQVAKQYVNAGLAAQASGDYETAITFYLKAYQLVPHPTLLFNMAQAHRLAGHIDRALALYKRYLSEDPRGAEAETARQHVSEIETRRADDARKAEHAHKDDARKAEHAHKDDARKADDARKDDAHKDDARKAEHAHKADARKDDARKADDAHNDDARNADDAPTAADTPDAGETLAATAPSTGPAADPPAGNLRDTASAVPPRPGAPLKIAGLAAGAGGVAVLALGIGFGVHARSLSNDLSRRDAVYDPEKIRAGERADTIAIAGVTGGVALIATGAALYWWGSKQGRARERVSVAPFVLDRTAGLVVSGAWP